MTTSLHFHRHTCIRPRGLRRHIVVALLLLLSCSIVAAGKNKTVQRYMTREQVTHVLGKPDALSFDQAGETWTYFKRPLLSGVDKLITVDFDLDGKVVRYQERIVPDGFDQQGRPPVVISPCDDQWSQWAAPLDESAFAILSQKVKAASFNQEKYDLLQVASLGCCYTCAQCASLMAEFGFDDERLEALRIMVPRVVDPQNAAVVESVLTFDSSKSAARGMLQRLP